MDLVDVLLEVLDRDASDLHLTVGSPPIIRINGQLERMDYPRLSANDPRELIFSILAQDQRQRLENEWEIDFSYSVPGRARFRVNAYFQRNSLGAAFRLIPEHARTQCRPVQRAIGLQDVGTKMRGDLCQCRFVGFDHDPGGNVCIHHRDAVLLKASRDCRFATANTAGDTHHQCHSR